MSERYTDGFENVGTNAKRPRRILIDDELDLIESDKQEALSGLSLTAVTVGATDKVLVQDASDSSNLKTVTAQSIADLVIDSVVADTKQDIVSGVSDTEIGYLDGVTSAIQTQFGAKADTTTGTIADLANDANGTAIATTVNAIIAALVASGVIDVYVP